MYLGYHEFCEHPGLCGYIDVKGLFRLNPATQEFTPVLPFREDQKQYAIALSNDANVLAFIILGTHVLHLQGLSEDVDSEISLPSNQRSYGDMIWSPDDQKLLFASSSYEEAHDFTLWLFDSNDSSITQLLAEVDKEFYITGWIDNSTILLHQSNAGPNQPFRHTYNLQTGELLLVEATPSPTP